MYSSKLLLKLCQLRTYFSLQWITLESVCSCRVSCCWILTFCQHACAWTKMRNSVVPSKCLLSLEHLMLLTWQSLLSWFAAAEIVGRSFIERVTVGLPHLFLSIQKFLPSVYWNFLYTNAMITSPLKVRWDRQRLQEVISSH